MFFILPKSIFLGHSEDITQNKSMFSFSQMTSLYTFITRDLLNPTIHLGLGGSGFPALAFKVRYFISFFGNCFEPRSLRRLPALIVRMRVVLKRTVVGDS